MAEPVADIICITLRQLSYIQFKKAWKRDNEVLNKSYVEELAGGAALRPSIEDYENAEISILKEAILFLSNCDSLTI